MKGSTQVICLSQNTYLKTLEISPLQRSYSPAPNLYDKTITKIFFTWTKNYNNIAHKYVSDKIKFESDLTWNCHSIFCSLGLIYIDCLDYTGVLIKELY